MSFEQGYLSRQLKSQTAQTTQEPIDHVPPKAQESSNRAHLLIFEDNEAAIEIMCQERIVLNCIG